MRTNNYNYTATTLVTFKIGRGGRFHNSGHLSFVESEKSILHGVYDDASEHNRDANGRFCKPYLIDSNGEALMEASEYAKATSTGIGRLDFDGQYCTYYTCQLADCGETEANALLSSTAFGADSLIAAMVEIGVIGDGYLEDGLEDDI